MSFYRGNFPMIAFVSCGECHCLDTLIDVGVVPRDATHLGLRSEFVISFSEFPCSKSGSELVDHDDLEVTFAIRMQVETVSEQPADRAKLKSKAIWTDFMLPENKSIPDILDEGLVLMYLYSITASST
jgi:hypothetical protein